MQRQAIWCDASVRSECACHGVVMLVAEAHPRRTALIVGTLRIVLACEWRLVQIKSGTKKFSIQTSPASFGPLDLSARIYEKGMREK